MPVTLTLLAGLAFLYIAFGANVGVNRARSKILIGLGDDRRLLLANRAHGNITEWAPIAVMLIGALEYLDASRTLVAALAAVYFISRACHSLGILRESSEQYPPHAAGASGKPHPLRATGAVGGTAVIAWCAVHILIIIWLL